MTGADRIIQWSTALAVLGVATVAAVVSYEHAYDRVWAHGESGRTAHMVPLMVDGLIYASSTVMLDSARAARHRFRRWHGGSSAWASRRHSRPTSPTAWAMA
jgi:hypothetical protein